MPNQRTPSNRNSSSRYGSSRNASRRSSGAQAKSSEVAAALIAVGLIAILGIGFFLWSAHRPAGPHVDLLVGADISGSIGQTGRQKYFSMLDEAVDSVLPKRSRISMWAYDVNAHKFADKRPENSRDLWPVEDEIIATKSATHGTYPSVVLEKMLTAAQDADGDDRSVALLLLTDGEDADAKRTDHLMRELAALPSVKAVWICGATSSNGFRSQVEKRFTPMLHDRLIVTSANDAQDGLSRFRNAIERK